MNFIKINPYAFTKAHYFKSKLDDSPNMLDEQLRNKLIVQFDLYNEEFKKISIEYDLKNSINFKYIRDQLINLNKSNQDFTKTPIQIESDPIQDEIIHQSLLNKSFITLVGLQISKSEITTCLFNRVCINLG